MFTSTPDAGEPPNNRAVIVIVVLSVLLEGGYGAMPGQPKAPLHLDNASRHKHSEDQPSPVFAYLEVSLTILPGNIGLARPSIGLAITADECQNSTFNLTRQKRDKVKVSLLVSNEHINSRRFCLWVSAGFRGLKGKKVSSDWTLYRVETLAEPDKQNMGRYQPSLYKSS
jgi:hypothetical protein